MTIEVSRDFERLPKPVRKSIVNGCGPGMVKKLPFFGESSYFADSCNIHDYDYDATINQAAPSQRHRATSDKRFLRNMKTQLLGTTGITRALRTAQAYCFYGLVRVFGWIFYKR